MPTQTVTQAVTQAVHAGGRIVAWLVLALMALSVAYATAMVVMTWNTIGV